MSLVQRDFIRRLIEQLSQFVARITGLVGERRFDDALELVRETEQELVGPLGKTLEAVDAPTVALLLGNTDKLRMLAFLMAKRALLLEMSGQPARREAKRALELYAELQRRAPLSEFDALARSEAERALAAPGKSA